VTVSNQYAPPQISAAVSPMPSPAGWNNTSTTVTFTCTPGGLPIASCTSPQTLTTEGANQVVTGTATDTAGTPVSLNVTVNIDKTPPTLTLASPADSTTFSSSPLVVSGTVSDNFVPYPPVTCNGNTAVMSGNSFSCNIPLNIGVNSIVVSASDWARNVSSVILHEFLTGTLPVPNSVRITPVGVNMQVGATQQFTAVDDYGRPRTDAAWTVDNTGLASITTDSSPVLTALAPGTVTLTASVQGVSAQTQVNISTLTVLLPGTILWSTPPVPGYSPTGLVQAVPSIYGPSSYSLQGSSDGTSTLVQGYTSDGQLVWEITLPALTGKPVPDGFGGLLATEACSASDPLDNPLSIVDLDGATGMPMWTYSIPSLALGNTGVCPLGVPKMAIRQDGAVVMSNMLQVSPALVVLDGLTGQPILTPTIPPSTIGGGIGQSTSCDCLTPVGQPMVNSDGTTNVEYYARQLNSSSPNPVQGTLSLMQIAQDGTTTTTQLASSNTANLWPGQIIPDGQGGVLATWANDPANPPAAPSPYQAADVVAGAVASSFDMPNAPQNLSRDPNTGIPLDLPLVGGENGTAFVAYGTKLASFNVDGGSSSWNYQSPQDIIYEASTTGGGLTLVDAQSNVIWLDSGGNVGSTAALPSLSSLQASWTGAWQGSSVSSGLSLGQIQLPPVVWDLITTWATRAGSPAGTKTAVIRCAPLDPTTSAAVENAYSNLISFLLQSPCPFCISSIFTPLNTSQAEFATFLNQGHTFCDGTKTTEPGGSIGASGGTVADYFRIHEADKTAAITDKLVQKAFGMVGHTSNLKVYFAPSVVDAMDSMTVESMDFHEALHGFSGLGDGGAPPLTGFGLCDILGATSQTKIVQLYPDCWTNTGRITQWIHDNVFAPQ
ncbi:MAG: Ig-like domain-containing protein, partial [Thiobacillaceae bacterium]